IRAFFIDGSWGNESLSQINEVSTPFWPEGQRPYFYGALLWHEILESKKDDPRFLERITQRYAGRFPFFITEPIEDELGLSYEFLLQKVYRKYERSAKKQLSEIRKVETPKHTTLTFPNSLKDHSPVLSPDGTRFAFLSENLNGDSVLSVRATSIATP